ncbi:MAG: class I SAM-dependent methyltransferase [Anaerolineae bacterium]
MPDQELPDNKQWFESVYTNANGSTDHIPWADLQPNPYMMKWLEREQLPASGQSAVVIGCGLGDDAEELARRGFIVTAFDFSDTAINWCKRRFPSSAVRYEVADLLHLPPEWRFDFVLEIHTVHALPVPIRRQVVEAVAGLVAPGGTLLAIGRLVESAALQTQRPWPLTRNELHYFVEAGLAETRAETFHDDEIAALGQVRFQMTYRRPT